MKSYFNILVILGIICFCSCEEVIDVDVPNQTPKLVVDASINWVKGTDGSEQIIKLLLSTDYFSSETYVPALGADVRITNLITDEVVQFLDNNDGDYITSDFVPVLNTDYKLDIIYDGETYTSLEKFKSVSSISNITQTTSGGFNDSLIEVNIFFNDPVLDENYYLVKFQEDIDLLPTFIVLKDEFTNGNEMTIFFEKDDDDSDSDALFTDDVVNIELAGISKQYYNYMSLLLDQTEGQGPFATTPAPVNGNCINVSNPDKFAYGYFRLTEVDQETYIVE
jgi:hypothetical protein